MQHCYYHIVVMQNVPMHQYKNAWIIRWDAENGTRLEIENENGSENKLSRKIWHKSCYNTKLHNCNQSWLRKRL